MRYAHTLDTRTLPGSSKQRLYPMCRPRTARMEGCAIDASARHVPTVSHRKNVIVTAHRIGCSIPARFRAHWDIYVAVQPRTAAIRTRERAHGPRTARTEGCATDASARHVRHTSPTSSPSLPMLALHAPGPGAAIEPLWARFPAFHMRLFFYVIPWFVRPLPGRRRYAHLRIKIQVTAG